MKISRPVISIWEKVINIKEVSSNKDSYHLPCLLVFNFYSILRDYVSTWLFWLFLFYYFCSIFFIMLVLFVILDRLHLSSLFPFPDCLYIRSITWTCLFKSFWESHSSSNPQSHSNCTYISWCIFAISNFY